MSVEDSAVNNVDLAAPKTVEVPGSSLGKPAENKVADRRQKLKDLHAKRNLARQLNHKEVVEEDKRNKLPSNWESKKEWAEKKLEQELGKERLGKHQWQREMLLEVGASDAEQWERRKSRKNNPDPGFSNYEDATIRQYNRLSKHIEPDLENYAIQRATAEQSTDIQYGTHKPTEESVNRMVDDLQKQIDKKSKYRRRRRFDNEASIDYINEKNMKFNKKLDRFYGDYTAEIKQNLERGTAV